VTWLFILLAMAVIALVTGVVTGRIAASMEPPSSSLPFRGLAGGDLRPADLEQLRFDAALRGYRMDQVDGVLDRLAEELARRADEIAALRSELAEILGEPGADDLTTQPRSPYAAARDDYPVDDYPVDDRLVDDEAVDDEAVDEAYGPAYIPPAGGIDLGGWPERGRD